MKVFWLCFPEMTGIQNIHAYHLENMEELYVILIEYAEVFYGITLLGSYGFTS